MQIYLEHLQLFTDVICWDFSCVSFKTTRPPNKKVYFKDGIYVCSSCLLGRVDIVDFGPVLLLCFSPCLLWEGLSVLFCLFWFLTVWFFGSICCDSPSGAMFPSETKRLH